MTTKSEKKLPQAKAKGRKKGVKKAGPKATPITAGIALAHMEQNHANQRDFMMMVCRQMLELLNNERLAEGFAFLAEKVGQEMGLPKQRKAYQKRAEPKA